MTEDTILNLMIEHHALLEVLFDLFKAEAKDKSPGTDASLAEFTWEIKKHFFIEENAIFDYLPLKTLEVFKTMNHLRDEHITMLAELKDISEDLPEVKDENLENFHNLLEHHREIEEKELYPKLDKELRDEQKRQIISRINDIPINNPNK